jgi:hypothetical protein
MKRWVWLLVCTAPAWAALTTVTQTVKGPDGAQASGTVFIRITAACRSGTDYIGDKTVTSQFTNGAFAVRLVPNDRCVPAGTSYSVSWQLIGGKSWNETWVVPTSTGSIGVDAVRMATPPLPTVAIPVAQLDLGSVDPAKTYCLKASSGITQAAECTPGGSKGKCWYELMSTTWESLQ